MPRPSITWLTTDTHFHHDLMFTLCNRPPDYNEQIIRWWKYYIAPQDTLIHLGDVMFYKWPYLPLYMEAANCKKILVLGNHDDSKTAGWFMRNGFDFACDGLLLGDVYFSHKPVNPLPSQASLNIHGHWHNTVEPLGDNPRPAWYSDKTHKLICLEKEHYKPVNLQTIVDLHRKAQDIAA